MATRRSVLRRGLGLGLAGWLGSSAAGTAVADDHEPVFHVDFDDAATGDYEPSSADWGGLSLDVVSEEFLSVAETDDGDRVLDARFPEGVAGAGNTNGGGDFIVDLGEPREEFYCGYRIRFDENFEFRQPGGKLPGLAGTTDGGERSITGGVDPDGENGWSARMMWRDPPDPTDGGLVEFYVYHPDKDGEWGDDLYWEHGPSGQVHFRRGEWHRVEHRVVMNTPGERDGVLQGWFDGELAFERTDLRFRDVPELGIDDFYFSCFFGGSQTEHWAHDREERIQFDDLVVAGGPIWQDDVTACDGGVEDGGATVADGAESATVDGWTVCDVDGDGHYRDVTGDGTVGQTDVVEFFEVQHRDAWKQPSLFDFSGNGEVGHGDVVALFEHVATS